jgi:hypothetical protein
VFGERLWGMVQSSFLGSESIAVVQLPVGFHLHARLMGRRNEAPRVHHASRQRGGVAALLPSAQMTRGWRPPDLLVQQFPQV